MVSLSRHLHCVTQNCANINSNDQIFLDFANKHLFYDDGNDEYLLISVYSVIKPSMGPEFILNTLLSLRIFSTQHELLLNDTLRSCFCNTKLIGGEDDPDSLWNYLNQVINIFVNDHLVFFFKGSTYDLRFYYLIWRSIG